MAEGRIVGYVPPPGSTERTKLIRLKVIAGHNLAKKDIFGASDPYTRIDLVTVDGDEVEDSVLTKTKKRTLNPKWEEEFIFRVKPDQHKLVFEVFDENRLTRDDFLGMVELPLLNIPKEADGRPPPHKYYILRPRSARSKVRGHLQLYHAFVADSSTEDDEDEDTLDGARNMNGQTASASSASGAGVPSRAPEEDWEIVGASEAAATSLQGLCQLFNDDVTFKVVHGIFHF
jgi:E3 ubiquitin-protein ligase NEDD4